MIVQLLSEAPPSELAAALERFEEQFTYPLGPGRSFRISHGADYSRFFRAIGQAVCFVAKREARVLGVIGAVLRSLLLPNGDSRPVLYLGDLKVDPSARSGRTLARLAYAVRQWVDARADAAFGIVMDGTPIVPSRYTGRLDIPLFQELGRVTILRLTTAASAQADGWEASDDVGAACYTTLSAGRYASPGGFPRERSEIEPLWLVEPDGHACGRLEDTRRAKRLIADDGAEMRSAHLSCFAYREVAAGVQLLRIALHRAAHMGFPALFVAVAAPEALRLCELLQDVETVVAPATVYGTGLPPGLFWNINTAEI